MADYHISKAGDRWKIGKAGAMRASGFAPSKAEAQQVARGFAERSGGGEVREHSSRDGSVHRRGQFIDSDTYGKPDPRSSGD